MKAMKQKSSKDFHPETLIYTGLNGEKVRSKGELLIQTQLIRHGINFVYEPLMEVNTTTMHPDFLVMQNKYRVVYSMGTHGYDGFGGIPEECRIKTADVCGSRFSLRP